MHADSELFLQIIGPVVERTHTPWEMAQLALVSRAWRSEFSRRADRCRRERCATACKLARESPDRNLRLRNVCDAVRQILDESHMSFDLLGMLSSSSLIFVLSSFGFYPEGTALAALSPTGCNMGDEGAKALGVALQMNKSVQSINLFGGYRWLHPRCAMQTLSPPLLLALAQGIGLEIAVW